MRSGYNIDETAAGFVGSPAVRASIIAKNALIETNDPGPAIFDCVVAPVDRTESTANHDSRAALTAAR